MIKSRLLTLLRDNSGRRGIKILITASFAGILQSLVVVILNAAADNLTTPGLNFRYLMLFLICITGFLVLKNYSLTRTVTIVQELIFDIRLRIAEKISDAGLTEIEEMEKSKIYTVFAENADRIFEAAKRCADASASIVMVLFSFFYIFMLSPAACGFAILLIALGISVFLFNEKSTEADMRESMVKETAFFASIEHLLAGFKEMKINTAKRDDLFATNVNENAILARKLKTRTEYQFIRNYLFSLTFFYILLACTLFVLPQMADLESSLIISIMAVILFMIGPLGSIVEAIPLISKADVAIEAIDDLEAYLDKANDVKMTQKSQKEADEFREIQFKNLMFHYKGDNGARFNLGPVNETLSTGEILFIVGGNGSGKSTFLKLITGLYYPHGGQVVWNGTPMDEKTYAHYRNLFSIVFTDFHLFDRLYGLPLQDTRKVDELLKLMRMDEKTEFDQDRFTTINLSTGQKKRLALIVSYLENKPILAFDEVAADQDPEFRRYFYEVLLPDLKAQGKTIVAVSHDDRFFHVADRIIKMEYGKIVRK